MLSDVKFGRAVKPRALLAEGAVFRGGQAFFRVPARAARAAVVMEFVRDRAKFRYVGLGRADRAEYAGLFDE